MTWVPIVGKSFSAVDFDAYVRSLEWPEWRPSFVVLHNTAEPSLAQRPNGLSLENINGLATFYQNKQPPWHAGPHLFVDDHQIWVFTPLTVPGVHSPSWNKFALGVEMLGDYETEAFDSGRGLEVQTNAVAAIASLSTALGIDPSTMRLHREDPNTTHACPGKNVNKTSFIQAVKARIAASEAAIRLASVPTSYTVRDGDTVYSIARALSVEQSVVLAANNGSSVIRPGQVLAIG